MGSAARVARRQAALRLSTIDTLSGVRSGQSALETCPRITQLGETPELSNVIGFNPITNYSITKSDNWRTEMADLQQLEDQIVGLSLLDAAQLVKRRNLVSRQRPRPR